MKQPLIIILIVFLFPALLVSQTLKPYIHGATASGSMD